MGNLRALETAQALDHLGLQVLPAIPRGKRPAVDWRKWQTIRTTDQLAAWFGGSRDYNYWVMCGVISKVIVLDCDNEIAEAQWRKKIGAAMDATTCVRTSKGFHYWFRIDGPWEGWAVGTKESPPEEPRFDVKADGGGVLAPPSVHPDGPVYQWVRGLDAIQMAPEALRKPGAVKNGAKSPKTRTGAGAVQGEARVDLESQGLAALLAGGPSDPKKGNVWMTRVAGHYAKWIPIKEAFEATIRNINAGLKDPIEEGDITKLIDSIWKKEEEKLEEPTEETGWLSGTGTRLMTHLKTGEWAEWGNFDLKCQGVIHDENDYRSYMVDVCTADRVAERDLLEPSTLGSPPRLQIWLAAHGVNVVPPLADARKGATAARLQRYLESQNAPSSRAASWLGFNDGHGFVTHEGIITGAGLEPHAGVIPHPRLRGWAPYRYGFVAESEARAVLREILTFQEEELCSVFGAWWAACFLKGHPEFGTSLWPYIALEAPSESGKTRGFFSLMIALTGNTEGHGESTTAALRDKVSAHRNGPVWIDDLSDATAIVEILRQATSEGVRTKKGVDRTTQETVRLVAPIVLSGESFGTILSEKAQRDRAIHLLARSPVARRSHHGDHPQWDDIQDLLRRYDGDLTRLSGTVSSMALRAAHLVKDLRDLRGDAGRHNDKIGVLRVGARVLSELTGDDAHIQRVDDWCFKQEDFGQENVLTTLILPGMLQGIVQETPIGGPAVFVHAGIVYFNEEKVAAEWVRNHRFEGRASLASADSIRAQRMALGITGTGKRLSILNGRGRGTGDQQRRYHQLSEDLSAAVLDRAGWGSRALTPGGGSTGVSTAEVRTSV